MYAHFDLPKIDSARVFGQLSTFIMNISGMNQDIDKRLTAFSTTIYSTLNAKNGGFPQCCICSFRPTQHRQFASFRTTLEFDRIYLENG